MGQINDQTESLIDENKRTLYYSYAIYKDQAPGKV